MIGERRDHVWNARQTSVEEAPNAPVGEDVETIRTFEGGKANAIDDQTAELPGLTEAETHRLLREWNDTDMEFPSDRCLHELFESQAEQTPDSVAATCRGEHWNYRELNARANQVAHHLRGLGVGPDSLVAICMDRSLAMVAGILGILKSGGAYVPLDPRYPRDRLAFMLEDSQSSVLLTEDGLVAEQPPHGAKVVRMDGDWDGIAHNSIANPPPLAAPDNLAYVIYTSGSTGRPKGVAVEHRAAVSHVTWFWRTFSARHLAVTLFATSICFDPSVSYLFAPLCHGCRIVVVRDIFDLHRLSEVGGVTFVGTVPSAMAEVFAMGSIPTSVRAFGLGGEALPQSLVDRCYEEHAVEDVFNFYGPTETTITSVATRVGRGEPGRPPIGRPTANTQVYVLDRRLSLVPVGVTGELYIGGVGLARGYLNRPELTAEKFIENPFRPGTRMYKTGDLVRWRADGNLEFVGRIDQQVKIRGHRIELGEIEIVLRRHPSVQETMVVVREDVPGEKRLVAYVIPHEGREPSLDDLRGHLRRALPEHMVPAAFVSLEKMPLMANGKLDQRALPSPQTGRIGARQAYMPSRTPTEAMLVGLWSRLLRLERVGIQDNFFELGGDSLLAARMLNEAQDKTGATLSLAAIFQTPTVAALAARIESNSSAGFDLVEPIRTGGNMETIVWVGNGRPLAYLQEHLPADHALYWCRLEHFDGKRLRYTAVEDLARHYCHQLWAAGVRGPCVVGGHSFSGIVAFEVARQFYQRQQTCELFLVEPPLPGSAVRGGMGESVRSRIARHRSEFAFSSPIASLRHAFQTTKSFLRFAVKCGKLVYCEGRLALGLRVPVGMRWPYVEAKYDHALAKYTARPFPGRMVVVQGTVDYEGNRAFWPPLAQGGVVIHTIHCHDHAKIVEDRSPLLQWIDLLRNDLEQRSQGTAMSWN